MSSGIRIDGRLLLTLWGVVYLLIQPLCLAGLWLPPDCLIHGRACLCPEMCRAAKEPAVIASAGCPECQSSDAAVAPSATDSAAAPSAPCLLSGGCRSERDQAVLIYGHPYLLSPILVWADIPVRQGHGGEWTMTTLDGYSPDPFHPPNA